MLRKTALYGLASFFLIFILMPQKGFTEDLDDLGNLGEGIEDDAAKEDEEGGDETAETQDKENAGEEEAEETAEESQGGEETAPEKESEKPGTPELTPELAAQAEKDKNDALEAFRNQIYDKASLLANKALKANPAFEDELRPVISKCDEEISKFGSVQTMSSEESVRIDSLEEIEKKFGYVLNGDLLASAIAETDRKRFDKALQMIKNAEKDFSDAIEKIPGPPSDLLKRKFQNAIMDTKLKLGMHIKELGMEGYSDVDTMYDNASSKPDFAYENPKEKDESKPDFFYDTAKEEYNKVITVLREAIKANPDNAKGIQKLIDRCNEDIKALEYKKVTNIEHADPDNPQFNMDPERPNRSYDMDVSLKQAQMLLDKEEYILARNALEKILARDPYNLRAVTMLGNLYEKLFQVAKIRKYNNVLERLTETRWKWNEPVLQSPAIKPEFDATVSESASSELYQKLNDLVIEKMSFDNTPIQPVINWIQIQSRELDPNEVGINIQLQINPRNAGSIPNITMDFENIPIGELIRYICLNCGLKYRVEQHMVIISDELTDVMETRYFKVRASLVRSIIPSAEGGGEEQEDMMTADEFVDVDTSLLEEGDKAEKKSLTSDALIAYFSERGVPFPEGSSIAYNKVSSKLSCTNTPENLRRLESLLREMDIEVPLVLVESKFIEITQNDLEDLSFEWIFSKDSGQLNPTPYDSWWQVLPNASTVRPLGTNYDGVMSPVDATVNDRLINNLVFPAFGGRDRMHLTFMLHALDQSSRAEVLSAPKVIATSGQEAIIRLGRVEYYPTSWTEPSVAVTNGTFIINPPEPDLGEATNTGVILTVTPTVNSNKYTIDLTVNPQVVDQTGWTDYMYNIVIGNQGVPSQFNLKMPEISRRDVLTNVKVYDGETLVLGGMVREDISSVNDQIPLIGDVPIVGRAFSAQNQKAVKRNLLVFVTARLINPDGVPIRDLEGTGLPDFKR